MPSTGCVALTTHTAAPHRCSVPERGEPVPKGGVSESRKDGISLENVEHPRVHRYGSCSFVNPPLQPSKVEDWMLRDKQRVSGKRMLLHA